MSFRWCGVRPLVSIRCAGGAHGFSKCVGLPKVHVFLFIIVESFIMTQLLFLALFFFLTFPVSAEKETHKIDLRVNGVGAWTPYSTVINKLGKPFAK